MLDQAATMARPAAVTRSDILDIVVIGAGIAGLNALYAATDYLPKGARACLVDEKSGAGGMWNTAYDYVRLHQPHPMFTVGDLGWNWSRPRDYLASRDEVRGHLASALGPIGDRVALSTLFGHRATSCREIATDAGPLAEIVVHPLDRPGETRTLLARRAVHAAGLNYQEARPLALSSAQVVSIIPQDLRSTLAAHPDAPLFVIGGGKTGMDTILAALAQNARRKITLVNGRGTNFMNRTKYIPTGLRRWTSGMVLSRVFRDMALHFDGTNEDALLAHFRSHHSSDPATPTGVFLYGLQSEEERDRVAAGLAAQHDDYFADIADDGGTPVMHLRSGAALAVPAGSIVVNCTGSFFRAAEMAETRPIITPGNTIYSICAREALHVLTSVGAFFGTHLTYREALRGHGFYKIDHEGLFRANRNAWVGASAAHAYMNQVLSVQTLPLSLLDRCGLDLDRWYPLPRRLAGLIRMKSTARADIDHCRATLDKIASRFGVTCGPID